MPVNPIKTIAEKIDSYWDESIEFQRRITSIPALAPESGGDGEKEKADFLRGWIDGHLKPDTIDDYPAPDKRVSSGYRPNMIATFNGQSSERTIWIMTHMDVVPPGDLSKWSDDPWQVQVEKDTKGRTKLIGRGTEDNQQGLTSSVFAVKALRDLDVVLQYDVGLIFVADEETGNGYGIKHILDNHRSRFRKSDLLIIPDAGNAKGTMVEVAEKSILWLEFKTMGKQCHASEPELGRNAHRAASFLVTRLNTLYGKFRKRNPVFAPPISTFEPTKREANVPNVNTIPGDDVFYLDCRILPEYKISEVIKVIRRFVREVEKQFKVKIKITPVHQDQAAPPTSPDAPVVKAIESAMRDLRRTRTRPMGIGGGTVAAFFRRVGIPAAVWSTMDDMAHAPDEYCIVENMLDDAKVFAHVFLQK